MTDHRHRLTPRARTLRRDSTEAERLLWQALRGRQLAHAKFRRQFPIGPFVADFVCLDARLIVELDGDSHGFTAAYDRARTNFLETKGFRVVRFSNADVMINLDGVLRIILIELGCDPDTPE